MSMSFTKKAIRIDLALKSGITKSFQGLECKVSIQKQGLPDQNKASISIMGLSYDDMAAATSVSFRPFQYDRNSVSVFAGEEGKTLSRIFHGNVTSAWADFNSVPDPTMKIEASTGFFSNLYSHAPMATDGSARTSEVVEQMAKDSGFSFVNQGVDSRCANSVFNGSPIEKAKSAAEQSGSELLIDDQDMILMPRGATRRTGSTVLISAATGMIGYPTFGNMTIQVKTMFNPAVVMGGSIHVESIVPKASGDWRVTKVTHNLAAYDPKGGPWETQIEASHGWQFRAGI